MMRQFIIRRLLGVIPTLLVIITMSFLIIRLAPGGPFLAERNLPEAVVKNLEHKYGLDKPLVVQYFTYVGNIITGDFGVSLQYLDRDVTYFIKKNLPVSALLGSLALSISLILGLSMGITSALKQNTWVDHMLMSFATIGISVPLFVVGPILMYIFAMKLQWLPTSGWIGGRNGSLAMILPIVTLSFPFTANIARLSRASVLEVVHSDFIRTARAKGLSSLRIVWGHIIRASITPVVSYLGPVFAGVITSSVVVETIFRVPGLGVFFVQSSFNRDYTLIMALVIVYSVILIFANLIVDILYVIIDPRTLKRI